MSKHSVSVIEMQERKMYLHDKNTYKHNQYLLKTVCISVLDFKKLEVCVCVFSKIAETAWVLGNYVFMFVCVTYNPRNWLNKPIWHMFVCVTQNLLWEKRLIFYLAYTGTATLSSAILPLNMLGLTNTHWK